MAAETNVIKQVDLAKVQSVDFVNRFGENISKLIEALGVTRKLPVQAGMVINRYKSADVTLAGGTVAEGEIIPLSKVKTKPAESIEMTIKKYRKAVTAEAIQKSGYDHAVAETDEALLRELQKGVRTDLFSHITTNAKATVAYEHGLQGAIATAWGQIQTKFEDDAAETLAFVNPIDVAKYQGSANITMQKEFGMNFVKGFLDAVVITNTSVPKGTIYATAAENIVLAYIPMSASEVARAFNLTSDETGFIGMTHSPQEDRATIQSLVMSGITLLTEREDGLVKVAITKEEPAGA
ncbi:hypothetical protein [Senegalia massiliensis]|uniref:Major capsid protein n=1 Tax=Senegalia massiliensis TaxID=1720316 RepID=A0A845R1E8_9CLOT|nr:hypothetical protein [Senegalia massiliensis]NBI08240.1 hypothetical protein [Senegalia massiliensis]